MDKRFVDDSSRNLPNYNTQFADKVNNLYEMAVLKHQG